MPVLPASMKAVRLFEYGDPSVLRYVKVPLPEIGPDEVLLRVRATSVNSWDLRYRKGLLRPPPDRASLPLPFQLGREAAGEVAEVGAAVKSFRPGDRAVAMTCPACGSCEFCRRGLDNLCVHVDLPGHQRFGGYAEYVAVREANLLRAPAAVPFEKLACCLWSYAAVWHMTIVRGRLGAGQDVLVIGGSSGMGTAAIQIARIAGARRVFATTGSEWKAVRLKEELGVDHVLNYRREDVPARVRELTNGLGVDLVLDNVGGEMIPTALQCVRMAGTLVLVGSLGGPVPPLDVSPFYRMEISVVGSRASTRHEQELVLGLAERGRIDPVISHVLPLSEAAEAHRVLERQEQFGKIVLLP